MAAPEPSGPPKEGTANAGETERNNEREIGGQRVKIPYVPAIWVDKMIPLLDTTV